MQPGRPRWSGAILICTHERDSNVSRASCGEARGSELRKWFRDRLRKVGMLDRVLPIRTGCLGVCSSAGLTVALMPDPLTGRQREVLIVDPKKDREMLWRRACAVLLDSEVP